MLSRHSIVAVGVAKNTFITKYQMELVGVFYQTEPELFRIPYPPTYRPNQTIIVAIIQSCSISPVTICMGHAINFMDICHPFMSCLSHSFVTNLGRRNSVLCYPAQLLKSIMNLSIINMSCHVYLWIENRIITCLPVTS
jgi:hypothetical protein